MEIISYDDPKSVVAESFKVLRTNLKFTNAGNGVETILVTSSLPGEGKSWATGNLSVTYTQVGKRVVIVDSDMRKGRQHNIFHVDNTNGLSNFLAGIYNDEEYGDNVKDVLKTVSDDNGVYVERARELLSVTKITELGAFINENFKLAFSNKDMQAIFGIFNTWRSSAGRYTNLDAYFHNKTATNDSKMIKDEAKEYILDFANSLLTFRKNEDINNIDKYVKKTSIENLYIIPPGSVPPNPSELLDSDRLPLLIEKLKTRFDVIIFDGTPCQLVADSLIVARHVDSVLLMIVYGQSKMDIVNKTKSDIEKAGAKVTGAILNKVPSKKGYYGYYGYGVKEKNKIPRYRKFMDKITSFF